MDLSLASAAPKPTLRGVLHSIAFPLSLAAGIVLICLADPGRPRLAAVIYSVTAWALFGVSAVYHRGNWSQRTAGLLKRLDHSNIFLIIAGSYTPLALLALHGVTRAAVLGGVWGGAFLGVVFRVAWVQAPRWLYTPLYVVLGWTAVFVVPQLIAGAGITAFVLIVVGGALYSLGGLVYGLKRPNPAPRVFGFHEVFHALTVAAFVTQYVAVSLVTYRS